MKVQPVSGNEIERIGIGTEKSFSINFDAKMARILADGLYSDKIQSVIRELSCNAHDSHVAAGCADKPIEVHFPNRFEPWFSVEDFGTGLSHDEVMAIYTCYGASTKTNSNDFIGQLGLGSKSPFALTDAFTVTARKDGIENHYSMYRDERSMPTVAHLHQNPTKEPNGVTVTVPVRDDQRAEFINKSQQVYKWFPVKPITIGDTVEYDTIEYEYQGTDWGIRKAPRSTNRYGYRAAYDRPVALMGLVAYPLDVDSIKGLSAGARALLEMPVVLTFAIGELEIAANREALGYDERTCAAIVAKMNTMIAELGSNFETQIAGADTLWNAKKKFGKIFSHSEYSYNFASAFKNLGLKWKNHVITDHYHTITPGELYGLTSGKYADCKVLLANHGHRRGRILSFYDKEAYQIQCEDSTVIMFNDLKLGGVSRVTEYNKANNGSKRIYVFHPHDKVTFDTLRTELGNPEVVLTSSLPRPERKKAQRTGVYQYIRGYTGKKAWTETEIDLDQGGYYVDLDGWDHVWNGKYVGEVNWWLQRGLEAKLIPENTVIYAMRSKNKKLVEKHSGWSNLIDKINAGMMSIIQNRNVGQDIANAESYRRLCDRAGWEFWNNVLDIRDETSPMFEFVNTARKFKNAGEGLDSIRNLMNRFEVTIENKKSEVDLVGEFERVMTRYPMLWFAVDRYSYNRSSETVARIADYINYVDSTAVFAALQDREVQETN